MQSAAFNQTSCDSSRDDESGGVWTCNSLPSKCVETAVPAAVSTAGLMAVQKCYATSGEWGGVWSCNESYKQTITIYIYILIPDGRKTLANCDNYFDERGLDHMHVHTPETHNLQTSTDDKPNP